MWKLIVGFILFAALALYVLKQAGGDIDMSGEKHGADTSHPAEPAAASAPGGAAPAAPAASK